MVNTQNRMVWILTITGAVVILLAGLTGVSASPQLPCEFYGTVALNGNPVPVGTAISAYVNGVKQGSISVKEPGVYGGVGTFDERLIVFSGENDFSGGAPSITFKIGEKTADQTITYTPGMSSELALSIGAGIGPLSSDATSVSPVQVMAGSVDQGTAPVSNSSGVNVQPTLLPPPAAINQQTAVQTSPNATLPPQNQPSVQTSQVTTTNITVNSSSPEAVQTPLPVVSPPTVAAKFPLNVSKSPSNQTVTVTSAVPATPEVASSPQVNQTGMSIPANNSNAGAPVDNLSVTVSFPSGRIITQ